MSETMQNRGPWPARVALLGGALAGLGLVMWVAAHWAGWPPLARLALVQAVLALGLGGAALTAGGARTALALLGWLAVGALLALIGQTYQMEADPWRLFALWTLLAVPVALAVRHDALWSGWALVAAVAVALWLYNQPGASRWAPPAAGATVLAAGLLGAVWLALGAWAQRWTGAGRWAPRVALVAALTVLTSLALASEMDTLGRGFSANWLLALAAVAALAWGLTRAPQRDLAQLAATALAALVLGVGWLALRLLDEAGDATLRLLLLAVLAAALLAALAWALLHLRGRSGDEAAAHWPLAALTALGAWLAAVPLLVAVGLALGQAFESHFWLAGLLLWGVAVALLRRPALSAFVQHMLVPVLLSGGVALAVGVGVQAPAMPARSGAAGLAAALLAAALLPQGWLRGVLGALALGAALALAQGLGDSVGLHPGLWLDVPLLAWLLAWPLRDTARWRPVWLGWGAAWLAAAMLLGGRTLLVGGLTPWMPGGGMGWAWADGARALLSAVLALVAALGLWRQHPALRSARGLLMAAVGVALAAAVPPLGGVLLLLALTLPRARALAALAVLAALWLVGTLYYELPWPLAHKGLALLLAGALLAASVWRPGAGRMARPARRPLALLLGALAATLLLAQLTIWRQQQIVDAGRTVYVALAPVDPRALLTGDYMRLAFELPPAVQEDTEARRVRARVDARGVATVEGVLAPGAPLAAGEVALPLRHLRSGPALVTDAYHFPEGEGARYERARFGVLRVLPDGRALLTGLADERLHAL